ncbi:MAG TPA: 3-dehydroquinate synthase, partial [Gemmatimonadales bacterium]|nr:3-dehydroquinate synthase [Gemmatimonadales bacterium]
MTVRHALGTYPVQVEPGALGRLREVTAAHAGGRALALVTESTVGPLFDAYRNGPMPWRSAAREPDLPAFAAELVVPAGEKTKSRAQWSALSDQLLERGFGRDSAIVALGGGVIGDLAGFVAATYLRGIPYLQVPTTLLAMLDASVGGKTGVDTPHGKNLIGAFHPPVAVVADPLVLRTLPEREYRAGLAEAVKHGLIADAEYFAWLGASADAIARRDEATLATLVRRSVEIKAAVVGEDEREEGRRAILNAGHTVAHAVEHASGYALAHGEAVALGLVAECELAETMGIGRPGLGADVARLLGRLGLPVRLEQALPRAQLLAAMGADKKNRAARVRFALPRDVGAMFPGERWTVAAEEPAIAAA